ncbi:hypothetical protein MCEMRE196_00471 [Candidatus Nanopelagicaceae bacterium]
MTLKLSEEEAAYAWKVALNISQGQGQSTLGPNDFAAQAIEQLLALDEMPTNLEGWLKTVIVNLYKDRHRNVQVRENKLGRPFADPSDEEIQEVIFNATPQSLSTMIASADNARQIFAAFSEKEQKILMLTHAGYTTAEIAIELGYANAQVVATKLGQIRKKLTADFGTQL